MGREKGSGEKAVQGEEREKSQTDKKWFIR